MKKILIYLLPLLCMAMACSKKTDLIFDGTVDERLQAALSHDSAVLVNATNGWKGVLYPGNGEGAYFFYMEFKPDGSVTMMGDVDTAAAVSAFTSTYRLKAIQLPTLIFDTYNHIHKLSDPNPEVQGGTSGAGRYADFEFSFLSVTDDSIVLKGNKNGSSMVMKKASAEEQEDYKGGALRELMDIARDYTVAHKYLYLRFPDGDQVPLGLSVRSKMVVLQYVDEHNEIVNVSSEFYFTRDSMYLQHPIVYKGYAFRNIYWDSQAGVFYVSLNNERSDIGFAPHIFQLPIQPPLVDLLFNFYSILTVEPDVLDGLPNSFLAVWNDCKSKMNAGGRTMNKFEVLFPAVNQLQLKFTYYSGSSSFIANCFYSMSINSEGVASFVVTTQVSNSTVRAAVKPMTDYIANNKFYFAYPANTATAAKLGGLFSATDPGSYFFGELK